MNFTGVLLWFQVCYSDFRCVTLISGVLLWFQVCYSDYRCVTLISGVLLWFQVCYSDFRCVTLISGVLLWFQVCYSDYGTSQLCTIDCPANSSETDLAIVQGLCDGFNQCDIAVSSTLFDPTGLQEPCVSSNTQRYLEVHYRCLGKYINTEVP